MKTELNDFATSLVLPMKQIFQKQIDTTARYSLPLHTCQSLSVHVKGYSFFFISRKNQIRPHSTALLHHYLMMMTMIRIGLFRQLIRM